MQSINNKQLNKCKQILAYYQSCYITLIGWVIVLTILFEIAKYYYPSRYPTPQSSSLFQQFIWLPNGELIRIKLLYNNDRLFQGFIKQRYQQKWLFFYYQRAYEQLHSQNIYKTELQVSNENMGVVIIAKSIQDINVYISLEELQLFIRRQSKLDFGSSVFDTIEFNKQLINKLKTVIADTLQVDEDQLQFQIQKVIIKTCDEELVCMIPIKGKQQTQITNRLDQQEIKIYKQSIDKHVKSYIKDIVYTIKEEGATIASKLNLQFNNKPFKVFPINQTEIDMNEVYVSSTALQILQNCHGPLQRRVCRYSQNEYDLTSSSMTKQLHFYIK